MRLLELLTDTPPPLPRRTAFSCSADDPEHSSIPVYDRFTSGFSPGRRAEFLRGRLAAEQALTKLGAPSRAFIERGRSGEPLWPAGMCGSITHTSGIACAVVGRIDDYEGIGIDLEPIARQDEWGDVLERCGNRSERAWARSVPGEEALRTTMLFSIKESIFKATFPAAGTFLDFSSVTLEPSEDSRELKLAEAVPEIQCWVSPEITSIVCIKYDTFIFSGFWRTRSVA